MPKRLELVVDRIECPKEVVSILMGLLGAAGIGSTAIDVVADGDHVVSEVQVDPQADPKRVSFIVSQVADLPEWYLDMATCDDDTATVPFDMSALLEKD